MKSLFHYFFILQTISLYTFGKQDPLLVATLMIKNEASCIAKTLEPLIAGGIEHFFIFDTGSTDNTLTIVRELFKKNKHCEVHIAEEPFVDFATSRNRALELAETRYPSATFIMMLDAEWYVHRVEGLVRYCKDNKNDTAPAYALLVRTIVNEYYVPLIMRKSHKLRYKVPVHEWLQVSGTVPVVPSDTYVELTRSAKGQAASQKRWLRDKEILLREHAAHPNDSRTLFYLGQTYCCLDDYEKGYEFFKKCIDASLKENLVSQGYEAAYNVGIVIQELIHRKKAYAPELALQYFHRAFEICPFRAEPLYRIAKHYYNKGDMEHCYTYSLRACKLSLPLVCGSIERVIYEKERYELLMNSSEALLKHIVKRP